MIIGRKETPRVFQEQGLGSNKSKIESERRLRMLRAMKNSLIALSSIEKRMRPERSYSEERASRI